MTVFSISKKLLRAIAIIVGFVVGILFSFHFWFISHAEDLLSQLVAERSGGKLKLEVEKFRFNWLGKRMELHNAVLFTTDDSIASNSYRIEVNRVELRLKQLYPIIASKKILIDSLKLFSPTFTVTRIQAPNGVADSVKKNFSLPLEMGRVYNSIREALKVLEVDKFQISNGKFAMINRANPSENEKPVAISNIDFQLDNLRVDSANSPNQQKILFSDNLALETTHQNIFFPDGRHRLSFSNFRINLQNRLAEFDSCTITAGRGDSARNSFSIFFDKLKMTDIDFNTLYHQEVIKADSVYCINPRFILNVALKDDESAVKTPRLEELVQQLTGDLQLKFVIVENGSFDINTTQKGRPSSFLSDHNSFAVEGLRILKGAPHPLTVERFAMALHNYETFVRDSSFSIQFDSILLNNNRISLGNFAYKEYYKKNSTVNQVSMPQFELYGLSWNDLVFQRKLRAEQVVLYKPLIQYNLSKRTAGRSQDIFQILTEVRQLLQLQKLNIVNGRLNLHLRNNAWLQLDGVTSFINAASMMEATNLRGLERSAENTMFTSGTLHTDDLDIRLNGVAWSGDDNKIKAASASLVQRNGLKLDASNVIIASLSIDEDRQKIQISGISWENASIHHQTAAPGTMKSTPFQLLVNGIHGTTTTLRLEQGETSLSLTLDSLDARKLTNEEQHWLIDGLVASGRRLVRKNRNTEVNVERFRLEDRQPSVLEALSFTSRSGSGDSSTITVPEVHFLASVNGILSGNNRIDLLNIIRPSVKLHLPQKEESGEAPLEIPSLTITRLRIEDPEILVRQKKENGTSELSWKGDPSDFLELKNLSAGNLTGIKMDSCAFLLDGFRFRQSNGRSFDTHRGQVYADIRDLNFRKNDAGAWDWHARISQLTAGSFSFDHIDKTNGKLLINRAVLSDLRISSSLLLNLYELVRQNEQFRLKEITGHYENDKNRFAWYNMNFDKTTRDLSLDSFSYRPLQTPEEFAKEHPYQTDYAVLNTGKIAVSGVNMEHFLKDTVVDLQSLTVEDARADDFRDKHAPREPGLIRPLPVDHLKKLPVKLALDSLILKNAWVKYGEYNDKTEAAGWIHINRLNGLITNIRNYAPRISDSLFIQASAYLEDSLYTSLKVKGSYLDTAAGFWMIVQMAPADLRVLNPALGPLAGALLKSGHLDTMTMRVTGTDYMAQGKMVMAYHDLKVMLTGNLTQEKKNFFRVAVNSIVNTILKNKNTDKEGTVFFIRLRDRSALNYLVKITLSGVASSVGLKKNKRRLRRYLREQRRSRK